MEEWFIEPSRRRKGTETKKTYVLPNGEEMEDDGDVNLTVFLLEINIKDKNMKWF